MDANVFDESLEKELDLIIRYTVYIRNSINGIKTEQLPENIVYADVIGQKIVSHILTSRDLLLRHQSDLTKIALNGRCDYSSVYILLRASLEAYLTFNYIFVSAKNSDEAKFRFNCWSLSNYTDKERFATDSEEAKQFMANEAIKMEELKSIIESSGIYQQLTREEQKLIFKGNWRMKKSWVNLACIAGYSKNYIGMQYSYLSGHAHANKSSIHHINVNRNSEDRAGNLNLSYSVMLSVLCKFNYDFIWLIPQLHHNMDEADVGFQILSKWKNIIASMD